MKILITYDSSNDTVNQTVKFVSELLRRNACEIDLADISAKEIDIIQPYDRVIIGAELWFGKLNPKIQKYLLKNQEELLLKPVYIFLHAYVGDEKFQQQLSKALSMEVLTHAYTFNLGMDVDPDIMNPFEKIRWSLTGQKMEKPMDSEAVKQLVDFVLKQQ